MKLNEARPIGGPLWRVQPMRILVKVCLATAFVAAAACKGSSTESTLDERIRSDRAGRGEGSDTTLVLAIESDRLFLCSPSVADLQMLARRRGWTFAVYLVASRDSALDRAASAAKIPLRGWIEGRVERRRFRQMPEGAVAAVYYGENRVSESSEFRSVSSFVLALSN